MRIAVERQRQAQYVAVVKADALDAVPVREALGLQGRRHVRNNSRHPDPGPDAEQDGCLLPEHVPPQLARIGQQPDHAPEQHRVEKLQSGHNEAAERKQGGDFQVSPEQTQNPAVQSQESHPLTLSGAVPSARISHLAVAATGRAIPEKDWPRLATDNRARATLHPDKIVKLSTFTRPEEE